MKPSTAKGSHSDHHQRTTPPMLTEGETAVAIAKQVNGGGGGGTSYRSKKYKPMVVMAARPGIVVANGSGRPRWPSGGPNNRYVAPNGVVIANGSGRPFDVRMGLLGRSKTTQ
ncbi:uncharacterized protein LMH87_008829 [Akanthomyces muscarius]|uniref:Uncharacterized protein n=1 Tax=Akanthomyces muscarius TaxID=2231603 RepID=A0A9W8QJZ6_AKAMU|nr:uncharacterized protein LMH87_008829 [Akanthomyces muscarius]KAJ4158297.1 hypothetical protein LMH87_008829 [Akanthomyces muscarius]